jgi:co-chaperonin GroES (HSP10)
MILPRENNGIVPEDYKDLPLPEDYEITELLGDVIMVKYLDVTEGGVMRNGIVLPTSVVDTRAWRVGEVVLAGPNCKQVKKGSKVIFPGDRGLQAIRQKEGMVIFLSENRIFGICDVKENVA